MTPNETPLPTRARTERTPVLIKLLRTYLRPYKTPITFVVLLQLAGTIANLYLPTLFADIIDNGVIKGDTGYIMKIGGIMLAISLGQAVASVAAVFFGARTAMAAGRDIRGQHLRPGDGLLHPRGRQVRRAVADHPHHQ